MRLSRRVKAFIRERRDAQRLARRPAVIAARNLDHTAAMAQAVANQTYSETKPELRKASAVRRRPPQPAP